ncbi:unnamed protein product [Rotaria sp. Silwood2]|nr:unnamed protein product [Rotaria sp. Silwood2]
MIQNALLKERRKTFRSNETNSDSLSSSSLTSVEIITKTSANVFEWKISVMNSKIIFGQRTTIDIME